MCFEYVQTFETPFVFAEATNLCDAELLEILEVIKELDILHETENYLPIFHLREYFNDRYDRQQLDQRLFKLQSQDKLDFSTIAEVSKYSTEQLDAGISQVVGGSLFYISI